MDHLLSLRVLSPGQVERHSWRYTLADPRTEQKLTLESQEGDFGLFQLDQSWPGRGEEKSPDGVLVTSQPEADIVLFIELKTTMKNDPERHQRAMTQLEAGVQHFAPAGRAGEPRSHGDEHHDRWAQGDDLPSPPPGREHRVAAAAVVFRQVPRVPPHWKTVCGKRVLFVTVQLHQTAPNEARSSDRELCKKAGLLTP
jgi:hypothetical protein